MKKILMSSLVIVLGLFLVGCNSKEERVVKCTLNSSDTYDIQSVYEITTNGDIVTSVNTIETVTSDQKEVLQIFEKTLKETYQTMNEKYGGYTNNIEIQDNKLTSRTKIDYTKLDFSKLVTDEPTMKNALNSKNELTLKGLKSIYVALGATCEE